MKRTAPFGVRSNRKRSTSYRFLMEYIWKFGSKNVAFLTSRMFASSMIRVSSKFGALRGCVRNPQTILGFPSVPCGTRESAHCLWLVGHTPWIVQTWKRHGIRCKHSAGRNAHIFLKRIFHLHFHQKSKGMIFLIYYFSRQKGPSASSDSPSFSFIGSIIFISTPSLVRAWNLRLQ